jgi:hypothetical protein
MQTEIFCLCDAATESGGKLNILGAFDGLAHPDFPIVLPLCSVALRLRVGGNDVGPHELEINLVEQETGNSVRRMPFSFTIPEGIRNSTAAVNAIFAIQGLKFEHPAIHSLELSVDGILRGSIPLIVSRIERRSPTAPPASSPA